MLHSKTARSVNGRGWRATGLHPVPAPERRQRQASFDVGWLRLVGLKALPHSPPLHLPPSLAHFDPNSPLGSLLHAGSSSDQFSMAGVSTIELITLKTKTK